MSNAPRCLIRGSINVDEYFNVKNIVQPGETITTFGLVKQAGGKGANQAVAVAKAGGQADFVGAVGQDGIWTIEHIRDLGVDISGSEHVSESTGRALVQVAEDGENSIKRDTSRNDSLLVQNEIQLDETLLYMAEAHSRSIVTIFNPSPMPTKEELQTIPWNQLSWLIVNDIEARDLYKVLSDMHPSTDEAKVDTSRYAAVPAYATAHRLLSQMPTTNLVCTLGGNGVLVLLPTILDDQGLPEPIYLKAAVLDKGVVDTTGAGDTFTGYMAAGLMKLQHEKGSKELNKADVTAVIKRCVQAAGLCVQTLGAMASIPDGAEVDARLK